MQKYNVKKEGDYTPSGIIHSGEELDIAGKIADKDGVSINFDNIELFQLIIRNMNGVVYCEYSTIPVGSQGTIETKDDKFTCKLTSEQSCKMRGLYIIETKIKTSTDTFIDVSKPFEVVDDFIKRTKEQE